MLVAGLAFLVGGLWLSPDLDTHSNATRRWGPLRGLWFPYRQLIRHRSLLFPQPVSGHSGTPSLSRGSVGGRGGGAGSAAGDRAGPDGQRGSWMSGPAIGPCFVAGLTGVEASGWLHLLLDGDPEFHLPMARRKPPPQIQPMVRAR
jgi:hypothetical protein